MKKILLTLSICLLFFLNVRAQVDTLDVTIDSLNALILLVDGLTSDAQTQLDGKLIDADSTEFRTASDIYYQPIDSDLDNPDIPLDEISDTLLLYTGNVTLTEEEVEDYVGGMVTGNTETRIAVTYEDGDGTIDFVVDDPDTTAFRTFSDLKYSGAQDFADVLGADPDGNDVDQTSLGKLEFFDAGLYLDADADGVMNLTSDGTLELHSNDWDISTTGAITNASGSNSQWNNDEGYYDIDDVDGYMEDSLLAVTTIGGFPYGKEVNGVVSWVENTDPPADGEFMSWQASDSTFVFGAGSGLTEEEVEDYVGGMLGGTETGISVTYEDGTNDIDFVVTESDPTVDTDDEIIAIINASPSTQIGVPAGGTGAATFTDHGVLVGSGAGAVTVITELADGYLLIGETGSDPSSAALTPGDGIDITEGAASITITVEDATVTNEGMVELATTAETTTGTDEARAVTPNGLEDGFDGSTNIVTLGTIATGVWNGTDIADADVANDITIDLATLATTLTITDNESTAEENPIVFVAGADPDGGDLGLETDGTATYNPSTGTITATAFSGNLTAANSVDSDQYVDASIDEVHMSVNSIDSDSYVDASIDLAHMSVESVDSDQYVDASIDFAHLGVDAGGSITPVTDAAADFAANFTGVDLYGGTFVCDVAGTIQLPAIGTGGMNFTITTVGAIAIVIEPNASDAILLDGTQLDDADSATNLSTAGDVIVFQYYDATGWLAHSNGWTDED